MDKKEINAAIERLLNEDALIAWNVTKAFMGSSDSTYKGAEKYRDRLLELLHITSTALDVRDSINDEYIRLPVDADGVPIHIGDVMAYADNTKPMDVVALVPPAVFLTEDGPRYAEMCRHYHEPTVEDMLRDAINAVVKYAKYLDKELVNAYVDETVEAYGKHLRELMAHDDAR